MTQKIIARLRRWRLAQQARHRVVERAKAAELVRQTLALFGRPEALTMTDDEVEAASQRVASAARSSGVTVEQAARAIELYRQALNEAAPLRLERT